MPESGVTAPFTLGVAQLGYTSDSLLISLIHTEHYRYTRMHKNRIISNSVTIS